MFLKTQSETAEKTTSYQPQSTPTHCLPHASCPVWQELPRYQLHQQPRGLRLLLRSVPLKTQEEWQSKVLSRSLSLSQEKGDVFSSPLLLTDATFSMTAPQPPCQLLMVCQKLLPKKTLSRRCQCRTASQFPCFLGCFHLIRPTVYVTESPLFFFFLTFTAVHSTSYDLMTTVTVAFL